MRVLVTGSSGFVGSHLVRALIDRGDNVVGLDKRDGRGGDINQNTMLDLTNITGRVDVVVHLASTCSTPGSVKNPLGTFTDTVVTAVRVADACRMTKTPLLLTSSVKARDGMTPYGAAKRMVELWVQEYASAFGLPVVINRPGTIYGPGQEGSEDSGWIAWFCKARDEGFPVTINGSGGQLRDLLHVHDYVRLLLMQIDSVEVYENHIWDVGGGPVNTVSVLQMATHLGLETTFGPPRYGDAEIYIGKNDVPAWDPRIDWRESETLR